MGLSGSDSSVESGSICGSYYATRPMRSMIRAIDAAAPRPGGAPGQGNASMGQQAVKAMQEKNRIHSVGSREGRCRPDHQNPEW